MMRYSNSAANNNVVFKPHAYKLHSSVIHLFLQGIKYVMIPEGMRDFYWLEGLFKGEKVSAGQYHNKQ